MIAPAVLVLTCSLDDLRALVREAVDAALSARVPTPSTRPLVDKRELARSVAVSPATITRLLHEGAPHTFVGSSPRFDVEAFRAWLDVRGRHGTKATPSKASIAGVRLLSRGSR